MSRTINAEAKHLIMVSEGCVLHPYRCQAGKPTIGYGNTYYPSWYKGGAQVQMSDAPISQEMAARFLDDLLVSYCDGVSRALKVEANDNQFGAMVSLAYNIGVGNFSTSSVVRLFNKGEKFFDASARAFMLWVKYVDPADGVLKDSPGLVTRRRKEMALFTKPTAAQMIASLSTRTAAPRLEQVVPPPPEPPPPVEFPPEAPIPQEVANVEKGGIMTAATSKTVVGGATVAVTAAGSLASTVQSFVDTSDTVQGAVAAGATNIHTAKALHASLGWMGISMIGLGIITVIAVALAVRQYLKIRNMEAISK